MNFNLMLCSACYTIKHSANGSHLYERHRAEALTVYVSAEESDPRGNRSPKGGLFLLEMFSPSSLYLMSCIFLSSARIAILKYQCASSLLSYPQLSVSCFAHLWQLALGNFWLQDRSYDNSSHRVFALLVRLIRGTLLLL